MATNIMKGYKCLIYCHMILLWIVIVTTAQQYSFHGYQTNSGVREALLAVNAFCGKYLNMTNLSSM